MGEGEYEYGRAPDLSAETSRDGSRPAPAASQHYAPRRPHRSTTPRISRIAALRPAELVLGGA